MVKNKTKENLSKTPAAVASTDGAKEKLIEVATELFAEHGFDGTSTRDIAKKADLNISLISYYFGGKEGLYKAVINEFATHAVAESNRLLLTLDIEKLTKESFCTFMKELLRRMIPMKYSTKEVQRLLHREILQGLPFTQEIFENLFSSVLMKIVNIYQRGQKKGFIREDINPYVLFFTMVHSVDQYILMMGCDCGLPIHDQMYQLPDEMDKYCDQLYKIFVEGVLK